MGKIQDIIALGKDGTVDSNQLHTGYNNLATFKNQSNK